MRNRKKTFSKPFNWGRICGKEERHSNLLKQQIRSNITANSSFSFLLTNLNNSILLMFLKLWNRVFTRFCGFHFFRYNWLRLALLSRYHLDSFLSLSVNLLFFVKIKKMDVKGIDSFCHRLDLIFHEIFLIEDVNLPLIMLLVARNNMRNELHFKGNIRKNHHQRNKVINLRLSEMRIVP